MQESFFLGALEPPKCGQKWDISGTGGGNKADRVHKGAGIQALPMQPFNREGRREGGSSSACSWDPESLGHSSTSPGAILPHRPQRETLWNPMLSHFAQGTRMEKIGMIEYQRQRWGRLRPPCPGLFWGWGLGEGKRRFWQKVELERMS